MNTAIRHTCLHVGASPTSLAVQVCSAVLLYLGSDVCKSADCQSDRRHSRGFAYTKDKADVRYMIMCLTTDDAF